MHKGSLGRLLWAGMLLASTVIAMPGGTDTIQPALRARFFMKRCACDTPVPTEGFA